MLSETWVQWKPIPCLESKYNLKYLLNNLDTFELRLVNVSDTNDELLIIFQHSSHLFQKTNIKFKKKTLDNLKSFYGSAFIEWNFFKVTNLKYAQELEKQSAEYFKAKDFTHYVFILNDIMLEILEINTDEGPEITRKSAKNT